MAIAKNGPLYCLPFQTGYSPHAVQVWFRCHTRGRSPAVPAAERTRYDVQRLGRARLLPFEPMGIVGAKWKGRHGGRHIQPRRGTIRIVEDSPQLSEWAGRCSAPSTQSQKEQLVSVSHNLMFYIILAIGVATSYLMRRARPGPSCSVSRVRRGVEREVRGPRLTFRRL